MKIWLSFWLKFLTALFWRKISDFNPRTCAQQAEPALRTELLCFDVKFTRQNLNFDLARFFFQIAKITQTNPLKFELAGYKNCYLKMTFPYLEMEDQSILRWRRLQMGIAILQSSCKTQVGSPAVRLWLARCTAWVIKGWSKAMDFLQTIFKTNIFSLHKIQITRIVLWPSTKNQKCCKNLQKFTQHNVPIVSIKSKAKIYRNSCNIMSL